MKHLLRIIGLFCMATTTLLGQGINESKVSLLKKTATESIFQLELTGVSQTAVQTPQGEAFVVHMPNGTPILQQGAPDVPKLAISLLIPETGKMAFEILKSAYEDYPNVVVAPSKGDLKRQVDPATVPYTYGPAYTQDAFFPGGLLALQKPFVLRDVRGQAAWIQPVQYNAVSKTLRVYTSLTVRVYQAGGQGENELKSTIKPSNSLMYKQLYKKLFLNYSEKFGERGNAEPEKMLVIAQDELLAELEPLVAWKRQMGIHTTVVPMSVIGSSGADEVYAYVKNFYAEHGIAYLFLVGDENMIQPLTRNDGAAYSCDNCFGYMDDTDHFPEIFVGRFHASSPEELRIMVNRNLEYEKTPLADSLQNWCATGMASTSAEGAGFGDDNQADYEHGNEWKANHLAAGFEKYWEFYDGDQSAISPTPGDETADKAGNPLQSELVEQMNGRGVSLYNYTGHGWEQGLASGNFSTDAVATLRNHHRYPICIAVACCAGNFTNNGGGDCLGEAFQRAGDKASGEAWGGIAGYFSSDFQSWSPPMEGQDGMNELLISSNGIDITPTIGSMLAYGNAKMIAAYADGGEIMADFWNTFGEPSTVPRTRLPLTLLAAHSDTILMGNTSMSVFCDVEGALVSLYWQGQTLATAQAFGGAALLTYNSLNEPGMLTVTVSQFNYRPYQGEVVVKPSQGAYLIQQPFVLQDHLGNQNQKADYGENVTLDVTLENVGNALATDITAILRSSDPNVIITDSIGNFTSIPSGTTVVEAGAFAFSVKDGVADQHMALFNMQTFFNDTFLMSAVPIVLNAPELAVSGFTIDDSQFGNNNKRMDSGETVYVTMHNQNIGHSTSIEATGQFSGGIDTAWWIGVHNVPVLLGPLNALGAEADAVFGMDVDFDYLLTEPTLTELKYNLTAGNYTATPTISFVVNANIEDFESGDFESYYWSSDAPHPWETTDANPYEGAQCAQSGIIADNQKSTLRVHFNVTHNDSISFARKVESEFDYDFLRFYIDDVLVDSWSGELPWEIVQYPISQGYHELVWSYEKDEFVGYGQDRAWIDNIIFPGLSPLVSTQEHAGDTFDAKLSPNPGGTFTQLSYHLATTQTVSIQLYDCLGRVVRDVQNAVTLQAGPQVQAIALNGLAPGAYMLRLQTEAGTTVQRLVKQ